MSAMSVSSVATDTFDDASTQSSHRSALGFSTWAQRVRLDTEIRHDNLPAPLNKLLEDSKSVPAWIYDETSPKYDYCKLLHNDFIPYLNNPLLTPSADSELSRDIEILLPQILRVAAHYEALTVPGTSPTKADWRHAMDALGFDLWDLLKLNDFQYRLEHSLQLPQTAPMEMYDTKPDASVFFRVSGVKYYNPEVAKACSSLAGPNLDSFSVLHWATAFKRDQKDREAKRQLFRALVSGLYQRRAWGFPEHFVFGTAHHSTTTLEVSAATWEVPAGGQELKTSSGKPEIPGGNVPDADQRGTAGATEGTLDTRMDGKDEGDQRKTLGKEPGDSDECGQIIIYELGTFDMRGASDMLRLCLLMRSTRLLAYQYREDIKKDSLSRIQQQLKDSPWIYDWPAPARPSPSKTSKKTKLDSSNKKRKLGPAPEATENKMPLPLYELGAHESVGVVGVETPLRLRYVEEMNSESKVLGYLAKSPWDQYEPVPDQVIDSDD